MPRLKIAVEADQKEPKWRLLLPGRLHLLELLAPSPLNELWEAEKAGWRSYVFGNVHSHFRKGSKKALAWQAGFDAASRSSDPIRGML